MISREFHNSTAHEFDGYNLDSSEPDGALGFDGTGVWDLFTLDGA